MMNPGPVQVRFWGVRGSVPTPGARHVGMGGNTPCVEVAADDRHPLVLDAGTGFRNLGLDLVRRNERPGGEASVLLSHLHWDHIQGIPFFAPLYEPNWAITFYAPLPQDYLTRVVRTQTSQPYFSAEASIRARLTCEQLNLEEREIGGMTIRPFLLNHPGGAAGFRIQTDGHVIVYACDHEHGDEIVDRRVLEETRRADLLIWDSQYTPDDYDVHRGWGHSTWLEGARVAAEAEVTQLILFHHDPQRGDEDVKRAEEGARREFPNTQAAREGLVVTLGV